MNVTYETLEQVNINKHSDTTRILSFNIVLHIVIEERSVNKRNHNLKKNFQ